MGVVVCGDDKGMIWLYDMRSLVNETTKPQKEIVKETAKIPWPSNNIRSYIYFFIGNS
jgi:hypothetical protein